MEKKPISEQPPQEVKENQAELAAAKIEQPAGEVNGPKGPEPTRYGDWDVNGRCSDF